MTEDTIKIRDCFDSRMACQSVLRVELGVVEKRLDNLENGQTTIKYAVDSLSKKMDDSKNIYESIMNEQKETNKWIRNEFGKTSKFGRDVTWKILAILAIVVTAIVGVGAELT
jgi:hypothetical protein